MRFELILIKYGTGVGYSSYPMQILGNLLSNAFRHTVEGSVSIIAERENSVVGDSAGSLVIKVGHMCMRCTHVEVREPWHTCSWRTALYIEPTCIES